MFFRLKATATGQVLKLLESYRDGEGKSRHRTVASLGNAPIKWEERRAIAKAVAGRLYGQGELVVRDLSEEAGQWVDRIVRQVSREGRWRVFGALRGGGERIDGVLADEVTHTETAQLGAVLVGWESWKRLAMPAVLKELGLNRSQRQAAAISVINRLVDPVSEHALLPWYGRTALAELMGNKLRGAGDDRFYRVSDLLLSHRGAIEQHLRQGQRSLFNLKRTILLYDLTNTHFEGLCAGNAKARRGANKQKRTDCLQIVVGMLFDQFGFEMAHKTFEGSLNDSKSLVEMIGELNGACAQDKEKALVVMDAGVATRENLDLLHQHGFGYLVNDSRRQRQRYHKQFCEQKGFRQVRGREGKPAVRVRVMDDPYEQQDGIPDERIVLCKSQPRRNKEEAILSNAESRFVQELDKLAARIERGQLCDETKIQRVIGRIQTRHSRVRRYYTIELQKHDGRAFLRYQRDDEQFEKAADLQGCYVLRTDERTLDEHQLWQLYISLTRAEDGFKALKSNLGLRPNRHQLERRVEAHVFICILAYHLLRNILFTLEQKADHRNWDTLKRILQTHCYTTMLLPTTSGSIHRIRKAGQPEECHKSLYRALGVQWRGLPSSRSVLKARTALKHTHDQPTTL